MVKTYCTFPVIVLLAFSIYNVVSAENITTSLIAGVLRHGKDDTNLLVSPLLLSEGLMQLYVAAEGKTAEEIGKLLQLDSQTKNQTIEVYLKWAKSRKPPQGVTLNTGNRIYVAKDVNILPAYQQQSMDLFNTTVGTVDFEDANKTASKINKWIAKQTNYTITKILKKSVSNTKITLFGAIYFHGVWKKQFNKTGKFPFYIPQKSGETQTIQIEMMCRTDYYKHSFIEKLDADSVEIPYANSNISMIILLPKAIDGIDRLVQNLNKLRTSEISPKVAEQKVEIILPKFKVEINMELKRILQSLGINDLFKDANLKAMTDWKQKELVVSDIFQKAVIEVNEKGSSAVAVKAMLVNTYKDNSRSSDAFLFDVNHPFVFVIKDEDKIYFAGRVSSLKENPE